MFIKNICLSFALLLTISGFSQDLKTVFHTDKAYYVAGEVVWFKLYLPRAAKDQSIAFKANVAKSNGAIVEEFFLKNEGELSIDGYYKIGYDMPTDNYQIVFSALDITDGSDYELARFMIPIVNDLSASATGNTVAITGGDNTNDLLVDIELSKEIYQPKEQIKLKVRSKDRSNQVVPTNVSISVVDISLLGEESESGFVQTATTQAKAGAQFSEDIYRKGRIVNDEGTGLKANVIGAYSAYEKNMLYTKSNDDGVFVLTVPDFKSKKPIQLTGNLFQEHSDINIQFLENIGAAKSSSATSVVVDNYMVESRKRKKIYQFYKMTEANLGQELIKFEANELDANSFFKFADYEAFENIAAFFNELLSSNLDFIKGDDEKFVARMYNPQARGKVRHFTGDPVFVLDGKMTDDADFVGTMSTENVESAQLFFITKDIREQFGTFGNSPFVFINTTQPNIQIPDNDADDIFTLSGIQPDGQYLSITDEDLLKNVPLFRPMVYWDANIKSNGAGVSNISFNHSDDVSKFLITVVAQDNFGRVGVTRKVYQTASAN